MAAPAPASNTPTLTEALGVLSYSTPPAAITGVAQLLAGGTEISVESRAGTP